MSQDEAVYLIHFLWGKCDWIFAIGSKGECSERSNVTFKLTNSSHDRFGASKVSSSGLQQTSGKCLVCGKVNVQTRDGTV